MKTALINKIIPFSNVDGPGNRTAIFFQGCSFHCLFCHNPETMRICSQCGACVSVCPAKALRTDENGRVVWNEEACVQCDACIRTCRHFASPRVLNLTVEQLLARISRAMPYIDGITTSGGDCTLYPDYLTELFREVRGQGKSCLIDANGAYDFSADQLLLDVCDGVMLDVKAVSGKWSLWLTGSPPDPVLQNLEFLLAGKKLQEVRTVIFPGRDEENEETVRYVAGRIQDQCDYKIIRYRPFGVAEAYQKLLGTEETEEDYAERFAELAGKCGAGRAFVV